MLRRPYLLSRMTFVLLAAGIVMPTQAVQQGVSLPAETVALRPSPLPGFATASAKCSICHSVDYIAYQPPAMTLSQWTAETTKMKNTYGAPIDAAEIQLLASYLTAAYGDVASLPPDDAGLKPTPPTPASQPTASLDSLLSRSGCLACHGVQQKIVGPAYRDVANKYRGDPDALSKVEASIRQGGEGRWGTVPMPSFASLSETELKTLAEFVLTQ